MLQTYKGKNDKELFILMINLEDTIDEHEMILAYKENSNKTPARSRKNMTGMVGKVCAPVPEGHDQAERLRQHQ